MAKNANRAAAEVSLDANQRQVFREFLADYKAAAEQHVPNYVGGGISFKIAAALIRNGWRKQPSSN
jgi:hypothetical protein